LINSLPGSSLAAKTGLVTAITSLGALFLSKEIFIVDAEFFEMISIFGAWYIWYNASKDGVLEYFRERKEVKIIIIISPFFLCGLNG